MSAKEWYLAIGGKGEGPFSVEEVWDKLDKGVIDENVLVYGPDFSQWTPLSQVPELFGEAEGEDGPGMPPPPPGPGAAGGGMKADEIDYRILGEEMQFVEIELDPGESALAEAGAMMYMASEIQMETIFGDGRRTEDKGGFMGKMLGAGKRLLTGESLFMTLFSHGGPSGKRHVAFAAPYPGKIIPMDLGDLGGELICQKDAFLCAARGVALEIAFQKKIGVGLFGGEGFIMQRLLGDGMAFVHAGGTIHQLELAAGQNMKVDTGCLVALTPSVTYDVQFVGGVKTALFGGEGFFFASLTGPGHVWLQSLPFSRLAGRVWANAPQGGGGSKGEGSLLGGIATGKFFGSD